MILGIFIGFVAGLFFSRDRVDPVSEAADYAVRFLKRTFEWMAGAFKGGPDSRKNENNNPENR
jgi:hypothetical protein